MAIGEGERTLEETRALASVCFILVSVMVIAEFLIHLLAEYFAKTRRKSLIQALDKIKSELMLLGFISLLLTVCEHPISNFCLPVSIGLSFLPCEHVILSSDLREEASWQAEMSRWEFGRKKRKHWISNYQTAHFEQGSNFVFDFQKYIRRALEKDFGVLAGISLWIWMFAISYIFFNAHKFHSYRWLPFIPLVMLLLVGTKLQSIITSMCLESHDKSHVVRGAPLVRPSDHFFWFHRPEWLLQIIHFILFQNSFQLACFTWTWFKFGLNSCFHPETQDIVIRLSIGVLVHFLCGYVTLPLYALVTQMGTRMREDVFRENVVEGAQRRLARTRMNLKRSSQLANPISSLEGSQDSSISTISSVPINRDASHSIKPDGPLVLPTKDFVIQVQNGEDQADQEQIKNGFV